MLLATEINLSSQWSTMMVKHLIYNCIEINFWLAFFLSDQKNRQTDGIIFPNERPHKYAGLWKKKKIVFHSPLKYSKNIVIIRFLPVRVVVKTWNSSFLVSICFFTIILIFYAYGKLINHVAKQNIR